MPGVDPRLNESGSSIRGRPRLSKTGHAFLRKISLYASDDNAFQD